MTGFICPERQCSRHSESAFGYRHDSYGGYVMANFPHSMQVSESARAIEADLKRNKRFWYRFKPISIVVTGMFLLCLFIVPVARGHDMSDVVMMEVGKAFVATLMIAMILGWMGWLMIRRTDVTANIVFCLVIIASGVWTTGLSHGQRSEAQSIFNDSVGRHLVAVTDKARELIKVGD